ncbi:YceD family protein [Methylomagnum ishizawai]|uniref:YceD family protein n=1 Tax=Methylomagnum ishizawai TaxID=1760988 RepID=UPI001C32F984|nr:YceD family protein [Methylomagnum ishizawai]BBL74647.1 hypothetical protein MishRS11D_17450 [Methylomagnum ishizawai]
MLDHLPDKLDPYEFVEKKRRIKGKLALAALDRLHDLLLNCEGAVNIDLEFRREARIAAVVGRIEAELVLRCQCCLEALPWPVAGEVRLGLVRSIDEANLLPEAFEPLLVESEEPMALADIVQDELLLAIPPIPQHEYCGPPKKPGKAAAETRENPFAALAQLKKTNL